MWRLLERLAAPPFPCRLVIARSRRLIVDPTRAPTAPTATHIAARSREFLVCSHSYSAAFRECKRRVCCICVPCYVVSLVLQAPETFYVCIFYKMTTCLHLPGRMGVTRRVFGLPVRDAWTQTEITGWWYQPTW